jgi:hypothetical protein
MASDGDRHQLGDPITRNVSAGNAPSLLDQTPVDELDDAQLRREQANTDLVVREADERGIAPDVLELARQRLAALTAESDRRAADRG